MMEKKSFVYGALILILGSLFNRVLGFIYQILLIRLIKPEGIGLFTMVYPIYVLVLVIATLGIPVAISKLVAEEFAVNNPRGAYRIFYICFFILLVSSIFFTVLCYLGSPLLLEYVFPNPRVYYIFLSLLPGIIIVSLCSAFRGFFQGLQEMAPTAFTQSLEQTVRVFFGLFFAYLLLPKGVEYAAVGASAGVVLGELAGFLSMLVIYFKYRPRPVFSLPALPVEPLKNSMSRIFGLAFPVTLTRLASSSLLSIDAVLIPQRLQAGGLNLPESTSTFGQFVGIAESLLFAPGIITMSLAISLIPAVSDALALNNLKLVQSRCEDAIRISLLIGLPSAAVFFTLSEELCGIIFGYPQAGTSLRILALGGPFLYLQQATTGILQGMGEASRPFRNLIFASFFKITGIYYLTGLPELGILGTSISFVAGYVIMAWMNIIDIYELIGLKIDCKKYFLKPLLSSAGMGAIILLAKQQTQAAGESAAGTAIVLAYGILCYFFLLVVSGGVNKDDFMRVKKIFSFKTPF